MILKIMCEICHEKIGLADTETLSLPIRGEMFASPDALHGVPAPFLPTVDWDFMRCPVCRHRPFIKPNLIPYDVGVARHPSYFGILTAEEKAMEAAAEKEEPAPWDPPGGCIPPPPAKKRGRKRKSPLDKIMEADDAP